jgi:hypothetical protein
VEAKSWVAFALVGVALLTVGIVISTIVEQERIPGSSSEYRSYSPFYFQGFMLAAIGGLIIIATIIGTIGSAEEQRTREIRIGVKGKKCETMHPKADSSHSYVSNEARI